MNTASKLHPPKIEQERSRLFVLKDHQKGVLGYLALIGLANSYAHTNARNINREIGQISADLIEPEFARMDRRNLLARKEMLEHDLTNIEKLKDIDHYEKHFIKNGKETMDMLGYDVDSLLQVGVPVDTLIEANIIDKTVLYI